MYVSTKLLYTIYTLIQIPIFYAFWYYYSTHKDFKCSCKKFKETFPLAKASASLINLNLSLLIISIIKFYRKYVFLPIRFISFHYITILYIYGWSIIHTIAHYFNFQKLKIHSYSYFSWGVGFTGHFLLVIMMCFPLFSLPIIRKLYFHKFIISHNIFFIIFVSFIYIHQTFCFIKTDSNKCPLPLSWLWFTLPLLLYICEIIYKYTFCHVIPRECIYHSSNLLELQLPIPITNTDTGHVLWLCCTDISMFEWHPFAITKYNYSNNTCSIIIKNRGNWTDKLFNLIQYSQAPKLLYHGPFLNFPKKFIDHVQRNPTFFIASGIGLSTFSSILYKLLTLDLHSHLRIIIISKQPDEVKWIDEVITSLLRYKSRRFSVSFYFTNSSLSQLHNFNFRYNLGRPNLQYELFNNSIYNNFAVHKKIYVYHSGDNNVSNALRSICKTNSQYIYQDL